jgi:undecaprenyl pyrophosphate synthase
MQGYQHFTPGEIRLVDKALEISEELTCNHYHISTGNWKKYGFEVSNLVQLQEEEITPHGLAQIARYVRPFPSRMPSHLRDYYRICLQDHNILRVLERNNGIELFPLMVYVLTHELVHVIRFRKFLQRFDVDQVEKEIEEEKVHQTTYGILKPLRAINLNPIFDSYAGYRCPIEYC